MIRWIGVKDMSLKLKQFFYLKAISLPVALLLLFSIGPASVQAGAFDKGSTSATLVLGSGQLFREDYLIIGGGVGHYFINGLELGLDVTAWTGGDPSIYEVTPKLTYVIDNPSDVKPYFGAFFNRTFIESLEDSDSYGYRLGFYSPFGRNNYVGIGLVYTDLQDCTETVFVSCSDTYTELSFRFSI